MWATHFIFPAEAEGGKAWRVHDHVIILPYLTFAALGLCVEGLGEIPNFESRLLHRDLDICADSNKWSRVVGEISPKFPPNALGYGPETLGLGVGTATWLLLKRRGLLAPPPPPSALYKSSRGPIFQALLFNHNSINKTKASLTHIWAAHRLSRFSVGWTKTKNFTSKHTSIIVFGSL